MDEDRVVGVAIEPVEPTIAEPPTKRAGRSLQSWAPAIRSAGGQRGVVASCEAVAGAVFILDLRKVGVPRR
eukprot:5701081-Lingulodinium_polyedra.AAC.1